MFSSVKAIFLDIGGTLYTCPELDREYSEQLVQLIASSRNIDSVAARELLGTVREQHPTKVATMAQLGYPRREVQDAFCRVDPRRYLREDPDCLAMLRRLRSLYELGIISNFRRSHVDRLLEALGVDAQMFSWFVTEDVVKEIKPSTEPFEVALSMCGHRPHECLYVGDDPKKDVGPAKQVGMLTVLVQRNRGAGAPACADATIESILSLSEILELPDHG